VERASSPSTARSRYSGPCAWRFEVGLATACTRRMAKRSSSRECRASMAMCQAQRERRDRMRAATAFAQSVYADPAAKAVYVAAAKSLGRQPFRLAVSDFLHGRTRIPPFVPCMAPSPETPADLAQGSHAADVQRRGSRELIPAPQPGPAAARARRSRRVNITRTPSPSRRARLAWLPFARPQERHLPSAVPLRGHSPFTAPFPQGQHRRKEQAWSRAGADSLPGPTAFHERAAVPIARTPRSDLGSGTFWEST
jgi:hypothetical protein